MSPADTHPRILAAVLATFALGLAPPGIALEARSLEQTGAALRTAADTRARGDFSYDTADALLAIRNADWPPDLERTPRSARDKYALLGIDLPPARPLQERRRIPSKPARVDDRPILNRDRVLVKFVDGTRVRLRSGRLTAAGAPLPAVDAILADYPEATLLRAFDTDERILDANRETGERISGRRLADLNNFYVVSFPAPSDRGPALANELLRLDVVETAYLEAPADVSSCADLAPATPYWRASQFHLEPAPAGVNAPYAWAYHPGGNGAGPQFWVCDLEHSWCFDHEDLDIDESDVINGSVNNAGPSHGTAVLGLIGACDNDYGMTGITPDVSLKMCDFNNANTAASAIAMADAVLMPGEVLLLEIHLPGPETGLACACNCPQFEYVPVEWDAAAFAAIETAVANGLIVVEAAGNGSVDLDAALYDGWFDRATHDSGAILVGAGAPTSHTPECWTNSGSRVDVHAYGSGLYTAGYGDLWG
ncbi:MAG: hypothetical protein KC591_13370, partial [Gemmatimonadetes bacterium]|nr:hypothetical protein [Gemmatimonadota bacterium]